MRTAHPPTCPHPACAGKTFSAQKGLRAHLKIHAERELEAALEQHCGVTQEDGGEDGSEDGRPRKRRRGGEVGRDWVCEHPGCAKDFKSVRPFLSSRPVVAMARADPNPVHRRKPSRRTTG